MELTNTLVAGTKTFSLVIEGTRLPPDERDSEWPAGKYGPDILDTGFLLDRRDERTALMAPNDSITTRTTKQSTSGLESLILRGVALRLWEVWQNGAFIKALSFRNLKRLALVDCNNPMLLSWPQYPQSLESLEIVNPDQTDPYKEGLILAGKQLAEPIGYFCHLSELNLQNVGAPICEVLPILNAEAGAQLKVLKLHDQAVTGVDQMYTIRRDYGPEQDCPMYKLLVPPSLLYLLRKLRKQAVKEDEVDISVVGHDDPSTQLLDLQDENDDENDVSLESMKGPVPSEGDHDLNELVKGPLCEEGFEIPGFIVALYSHIPSKNYPDSGPSLCYLSPSLFHLVKQRRKTRVQQSRTLPLNIHLYLLRSTLIPQFVIHDLRRKLSTETIQYLPTIRSRRVYKVRVTGQWNPQPLLRDIEIDPQINEFAVADKTAL
ncbi:MAG: hypothetical protein Q9204_001592 [Flavoplaca sp. TL-2023a]